MAKEAAQQKVDLITEELFREAYLYEDTRKPPLKKVIGQKLKCSKFTLLNFFPIIQWISSYQIKRDLMSDIIAGITVAIMHIPHGLAYASLGKVKPVVGFYMAIFPVFIYMLLGTSRHISIGTFAVVCAMTGAIVSDFETRGDPTEKEHAANVTTSSTESYEHIEIGAAVCLVVGMWQVALGILKLGAFTVIMSDSLMSGFTTAAAVHVLSYQLKNLFGVSVTSFSGPFKLIYIYIDFFSKIETVNMITMFISIGCFLILVFFTEFMKPYMQKKFPKNKIPIPIELLVIILGILISYFAELNKNHKVKIVGDIPAGFPRPFVPPHSLILKVVYKSLVIAFVALAINLSLAKIFAKKDNSEVLNNQEFIAYGAANIFASFFQCLPSAASLSRSSIQFSVGGKTQLASLFSLTLIIFILLVAGSLFEPVPYCVLSSIVVVSLKGLLFQILDLKKIFKESRADGIVWLGTFIATVVLDLDYGLVVGIVFSLATLIFSSYELRLRVLGRVPNTNIFLDVEHFRAAVPVSNILILQIFGNMNFINSANLEHLILDEFKKYSKSVAREKYHVVLSMSGVTQIDPTSVNTLRHIHKTLKSSNCDLYLTDCNVSVYKTFEVCQLFKNIPKDQVLVSVADAVEYLTQIDSKEN